jgi:hypothetical protein
MTYPWYETVSDYNDLQQGDFIPDCPILIPPSEIKEEVDINIVLIDSIVMSQSCDLVNGKIEIVLVCPFYPLQTFLSNLPPDQATKKGKEKNIDNLRKGHLPSYHLLNKGNNTQSLLDYQVVDFKNVYGIHFTALQGVIGRLDTRIRLLPPYREHLSQAFARYFMRVGLPQDIQVKDY